MAKYLQKFLDPKNPITTFLHTQKNEMKLQTKWSDTQFER